MHRCARSLLAFLMVVLMAAPAAAHAQSWDYLFSDLAWPDVSNPFGGAGVRVMFPREFAVSGSGVRGSGKSELWEYLFTNLVWPDDASLFTTGHEGGLFSP